MLAPAKDLDCGIAAINYGADAVYIGAPRFGAREAAGNSLEDIAALVTHAHKYWAKVYVTLNTLLRDEEILPALSLISQIYEIGVDGLIIQDAGLLECDLPPLPLIASTQMHNNTPDKVAFLEKAGFQRAILARELDLEQIKEIRSRTTMELECFVHGALCVCYSGQCYLSYALGGRSGNRGQCAQPCRKLYSLLGSGERRHFLSIRDLNLSEHLRELVDAGVSSLKIEGRLKDKAYVSNVVAYYRAKLDEVLAETGLSRSSSGKSVIDFTPDLGKTFNRRYTTYFLHGRGEPIGSIETPKTLGEEIGKVISVGDRSFVIDSTIPLHCGDGICFFDSSGELQGSVVNHVRGQTVTPGRTVGITKGGMIYRNHDHEFLTHLSKSRAERRIGVKLTLRETPDGLSVTADDDDGISAEFTLPCEKIAAEKPDQALGNTHRQLAKCGGTDYTCSEIAVELEQPLFLPISTLNTLRRGALENLGAARAASEAVSGKGFPDTSDFPYPETELTYLGNVLNTKAEAFYRRHGVTKMEPAAESGLNLRRRKVMTSRYCVRRQVGLCPGPTPPEPMFLVDADGNKLELRFDCGRCEMDVYLVE